MVLMTPISSNFIPVNQVIGTCLTEIKRKLHFVSVRPEP